MEDDSSFHDFIPSTYGRKYIGPDNDLVELLWKDGHVVFHSQTIGRCLPNNFFESKHAPKIESSSKGGNCVENSSHFTQGEETAPWFQYPLDNSLGKELLEFLYGAPTRQPFVIDKPSKEEEKKVKLNNDGKSNYCAKQDNLHSKACGMPPPKSKSDAGTVVDLGETSSIKKTISSVCGSNVRAAKNTLWRTSCHSLEANANKRVVSSPSVVSGCSVEKKGWTSTSNHAQKRKHVEKAHVQESAEASKPVRQPTAGRRSRAAEVHNLSERRRRDRINEKMRTLQELIPHCNKSNKASMLDEAIEYLKSLQSQLQMMWMGSGMSPMLLPTVQQYMSRVRHGISHRLVPSIQSPIPSDIHSMPASVLNPSPIYPLQGASHLNFPSQLQNFPLLEPYSGYIGLPQVHLSAEMVNMCGNLQMVQQNQVAAAVQKPPRACNMNSI